MIHNRTIRLVSILGSSTWFDATRTIICYVRMNVIQKIKPLSTYDATLPLKLKPCLERLNRIMAKDRIVILLKCVMDTRPEP